MYVKPLSCILLCDQWNGSRIISRRVVQSSISRAILLFILLQNRHAKLVPHTSSSAVVYADWNDHSSACLWRKQGMAECAATFSSNIISSTASVTWQNSELVAMGIIQPLQRDNMQLESPEYIVESITLSTIPRGQEHEPSKVDTRRT